MKIGEARQLYSTQIKSYQEQKLAFAKQKKELEQKMAATQDGHAIYANEAATLELTIEELDKKQDEYRQYMDKLMEQWSAKANAVSAEQQGDAIKEEVEDLGKIMEVARRLMNGGVVPATDEKKLMDYSMELYQAAKNIGALAKKEKKEEYDSLWGEEEEKEYEDSIETANNTEAFADGPEIVSVEDTLASVSAV